MNTKVFIVILLVVAGAVVFGLTAKPQTPASQPAESGEQAEAHTASFPTETKTMGVVDVEVTPITVVPGKETVLQLVMNNHSVDLAYDYTKIATLTDSKGKTYTPLRWTGNSGGHHINGQLIFPPLPDDQDDLSLTLTGVDNATATFSWK